MTTTLTKPERLWEEDLRDLGIHPPRNTAAAFQVDEDTINVVVYDESGGDYLDAPNEDHSGEDAWEWIAFDNGRERDEWLNENCFCEFCGVRIALNDYGEAWVHDDDTYGEHEEPIKPKLAPTDILIERYEHSVVRYAPVGEASMVDRQWDVAVGVAVMRFTKPETIGPVDDPDKLLNFARAVCEEYSAWCNGEVYGIVRYGRRPPVVAPHCPVLIPDEFTHDVWEEIDSCWGYVGHDNAEDAAKHDDL